MFGCPSYHFLEHFLYHFFDVSFSIYSCLFYVHNTILKSLFSALYLSFMPSVIPPFRFIHFLHHQDKLIHYFVFNSSLASCHLFSDFFRTFIPSLSSPFLYFLATLCLSFVTLSFFLLRHCFDLFRSVLICRRLTKMSASQA